VLPNILRSLGLAFPFPLLTLPVPLGLVPVPRLVLVRLFHGARVPLWLLTLPWDL